MRRFFLALLASVTLSAPSAQAETELGFYFGAQGTLDSRVHGSDPAAGGVGDFDFKLPWDGKSFTDPVYYGIRWTKWRENGTAISVDFNHLKIYGDAKKIASEGFTALELTDGLNILTLNYMKRWQSENRFWTPYVGAGAGVAVPRVEVETGGSATYEYQLTGPAVAWMAGVEVDLDEYTSIYTEYKGTASTHWAELNGGGELKTNILTGAINLGLAFNF